RHGITLMARIVIFLIVILAAAAGLQWFADRPGTVTVEWQDRVAETTVFRAFIILVLLMGALVALSAAARRIWASPATVGRLLRRRREQRGIDALSGGMIAIGAGDP